MSHRTHAARFAVAACSNSNARGAGTTPVSGGGDTVSRSDQAFAENAVVSGRREVEHATLAAGRAISAAVKQYTAHLVNHTAANDELMSIIARKQITITGESQLRDRRGSIQARNDSTTLTKRGGPPTGSPSATGTTGASGGVATTGEAMDRERAGTTYPWMQQEGGAFDDGFLASEITYHEDAIALFHQQTSIGGDPELKAFADNATRASRAPSSGAGSAPIGERNALNCRGGGLQSSRRMQRARVYPDFAGAVHFVDAVMPATRREPFTIPARCPWCDAQAGAPQNSGTTILANAVHVALECDACGQSWHVDIPITRRAVGGDPPPPRRLQFDCALKPFRVPSIRYDGRSASGVRKSPGTRASFARPRDPSTGR